jgi:hypothetical protein
MKKLIYVLFAFIALTVSAQAQETKKEKLNQYVSASLSLANSNGQTFSQSTYASVEYGIVSKGIAYGLSVGRGQLNGDVTTNTTAQDLRNYFWEVRVQPTFPLGSVTGSVILGAGSYFATSDAGFIEYGLGVSKSYGDISYGLTYSNWNGVDYVTPSVSYAF